MGVPSLERTFLIRFPLGWIIWSFSSTEKNMLSCLPEKDISYHPPGNYNNTRNREQGRGRIATPRPPSPFEKRYITAKDLLYLAGSLPLIVCWHHLQSSGCILLDSIAVEKHRMMLNIAPALDKIVVM